MLASNFEKRATRGRRYRDFLIYRIQELVGEEAEKDDEFWRSDLWEEDLSSYSKEDSVEDIVDDDWASGEEEPEEAEGSAEEQALEGEEKAQKKRTVYQDPKKKQARTATTPTPGSTAPPAPREPRTPKPYEKPTFRQSTVQRREELVKRSEAEEFARVKRSKLVKRTPRVEVRRLTQEELLEEAKKTEEDNTASLLQLLQLEEEKKKPPPPKPVFGGPTIITRTGPKLESATLTFTRVDQVPSAINSPKVACTPFD